jgi:hypothetical protein
MQSKDSRLSQIEPTNDKISERFLLAGFLTALGIWLLGSLLRTILRRRETCSICNGVGCDECGGGSS